MSPPEPLDLEKSFASFMARVYPSVPLESSQYQESRVVFFVASALLLDYLLKVAGLPETEAAKCLAPIQDQLVAWRARFRRPEERN